MNPCLSDTLNINTTKFTSPALTYNIKYAAEVFSWTNADVSSVNNLTICGSFTWTVLKDDGMTEIDLTVFTLDTTTMTRTVYTIEFSKTATYNM